jgi:hypothetical protein
MATAIDLDSIREDFATEVRTLANAQFESPQYRRVLEMPLTQERAQVYTLQKSFWNLNRRDCWAFAQALSPMDVKAMIWDHELDELVGNKDRAGDAHYVLQVKQSELIGLTPEDFENEVIADGTRTCLYAWVHLAKDSHWLKSVASCAALEVSNSSDWLDNGGMSYRMGKRFEADLGIPFDKQINAKEHHVVDVLHGNLLMDVAALHADTPDKFDLLMEGLKECWALDRTWKGILADMMAEKPDPA